MTATTTCRHLFETHVTIKRHRDVEIKTKSLGGLSPWFQRRRLATDVIMHLIPYCSVAHFMRTQGDGSQDLTPSVSMYLGRPSICRAIEMENGNAETPLESIVPST